METTVIVRVRKDKNNSSTDDRIHKNSTFELSGNYLIVIEHGDEEKIPTTRIPYNLDNVISWGIRKSKLNKE